MSKPFDATTNDLIEFRPDDWLRLVRFLGEDAEIIDADLATVTTDADRVFRIRKPFPFLAHIELQTSRDNDLLARLLRYNILLRVRYSLPVESAVVLLRREADLPNMTGTLSFAAAGIADSATAEPSLVFRYHVVRLWQMSPKEFLFGGLAILPLAPISNVTPDRLPEVIHTMVERVEREATPNEARRLLSAAYILSGLTHSPDFTRELFRGVDSMRESSTYQAILAEGRAEGLSQGIAEGVERGLEQGRADGVRRILLRLGSQRLGIPDPTVVAMLESLPLPRLEILAERIATVESWAELLV